jgi:putative FmdB family regulatory protein
MPIYTYRCENCGVQFERHQTFTDEPLKRCPECSKNSLRKVLTPAGIVFKGSGWYATDHKSASGLGRTPKSDSKETSTETSSSTEGKPESSSSQAVSEKPNPPEASKGKGEDS